MRLSKIVETNDPDIRQRLLTWASSHEIFCALNSNREKQEFRDPYSSHDFVVALGAVDQIRNSKSLPDRQAGEIRNSFDLLQTFYESKKDWLFGFLTYDLKNETEKLKSENQDGLDFPAMFFFQPRFVMKLEAGSSKLEILYLSDHDNNLTIQQALDDILETEIKVEDDFDIKVHPKVSKEDYISNVNKIKRHIQQGDIYEMNYCIEYSGEDITMNPLDIYSRLNAISPMPFSCMLKLHDHYLACASPERFIAKRGNKIISQPIKGTTRRGRTAKEDEQIRLELKNDAKEQSENVMIVDLVRNDLSRTAKKGTVRVAELFGIYTFQQLHQMISTVESEMKEGVAITDVIKYAFPMGSMTGAPKISAMQLIERYEDSKRGLYSGSAGYISPGGDFDFNVVIRSILYNAKKKYLSFMAGSAITANSVAEKEYEECLLKAQAMLHALKKIARNRSTINA